MKKFCFHSDFSIVPNHPEAIEGRKKTLQIKAENFEREEQYDKALTLVEQLAKQFPGEARWEETKTRLVLRDKLAKAYRKGLGALQGNELKEAQKFLTDVVALDLGYGEALEHLLKLVKGIDVSKLQNQLDWEKNDRKRLERNIANLFKIKDAKDDTIRKLQRELSEEIRLKKEVKKNRIIRPLQKGLIITYLIIGIIIGASIYLEVIAPYNFIWFVLVLALIVIPAIVFVPLSYIIGGIPLLPKSPLSSEIIQTALSLHFKN